MLVDMLGTEAMTQAWVAYSNTANDLKDLSNAYKEARTALEIGKIFYAERNVFGYRTLGIGRLLYQLPVSICEMFIQEIFGDESLDTLNLADSQFANRGNRIFASPHNEKKLFIFFCYFVETAGGI